MKPNGYYKKLEQVIEEFQQRCGHTHGVYVKIDNSVNLTNEPFSVQRVKVCKVCKKIVGVIEYE